MLDASPLRRRRRCRRVGLGKRPSCNRGAEIRTRDLQSDPDAAWLSQKSGACSTFPLARRALMLGFSGMLGASVYPFCTRTRNAPLREGSTAQSRKRQEATRSESPRACPDRRGARQDSPFTGHLSPRRRARLFPSRRCRGDRERSHGVPVPPSRVARRVSRVEYQARAPNGDVLVTRESAVLARADGRAVMEARGLPHCNLYFRANPGVDWTHVEPRIENPKYDHDFPRP